MWPRSKSLLSRGSGTRTFGSPTPSGIDSSGAGATLTGLRILGARRRQGRRYVGRPQILRLCPRLGDEPDVGVRIEHLPDAQVHVELRRLRLVHIDRARTTDDRPLADAAQERGETVGIRRVVEEELHWRGAAFQRCSLPRTPLGVTRTGDYAARTARTSSACEAGFTSGRTFLTLPSSSITNVQRLTPRYVRPMYF